MELDYQDNFFDCVIDNVSICANKFEDITKMYEKIYSMLRPGGQMFTSMFSKDTTGYGRGEEIEKDTFVNLLIISDNRKSSILSELTKWFLRLHKNLPNLISSIGIMHLVNLKITKPYFTEQTSDERGHENEPYPV